MKALVIGGDSLVGRALSEALAKRDHRVTPTTRQGARTGWLTLDLAAQLPSSLPQCDVAFICAAITGFRENRESPALSARVNATAPVDLARRLTGEGTRVVFLSTSAVLDCQAPRMHAGRPYAPRGAYGRNKAAAEQGLLALGPRAMVLRLTKVLHPAEKLLRKWVAALRDGESVRAFDDHRFSPLALEHATQALIAVAEKGSGGIYQASGRDDWSYAELAYELARRLRAPRELVQPCSATSAAIPDDEITPYTSLDTSRLATLCGFAAPAAAEVLDRVLQ